MSSPSPIHESEGDRRYREFFHPEFAAQRLGKPGYWQGGATVRLGLRNPVQSEVFAALLLGRTPEGERLLAKPLAETPRV